MKSRVQGFLGCIILALTFSQCTCNTRNLVVVTELHESFTAGDYGEFTVEIQDSNGVLIESDNTTEVTFQPKGHGTIKGVTVGEGDGMYGIRGEAESVVVQDGVATVLLTSSVARQSKQRNPMKAGKYWGLSSCSLSEIQWTSHSPALR